MAHYLYKYVFRGIGFVILALLITQVYLAIRAHRQATPTPATLERRHAGGVR